MGGFYKWGVSKNVALTCLLACVLSGGLLASGMLSIHYLEVLGVSWGRASPATASLIPMVELNPCILYPLYLVVLSPGTPGLAFCHNWVE